MGRKRKSRGKDGTPLIKATEGVADAGQTSKTPRNRRKEVHLMYLIRQIKCIHIEVFDMNRQPI